MESDMNQTFNSQKTPFISPVKMIYWIAYCENVGKNWPRYNGITLYYALDPFSIFMLRTCSDEIAHEQTQSLLWASSATSFPIYRSMSLLMISKFINKLWFKSFWDWS